MFWSILPPAVKASIFLVLLFSFIFLESTFLKLVPVILNKPSSISCWAFLPEKVIALGDFVGVDTFVLNALITLLIDIKGCLIPPGVPFLAIVGPSLLIASGKTDSTYLMLKLGELKICFSSPSV